MRGVRRLLLRRSLNATPTVKQALLRWRMLTASTAVLLDTLLVRRLPDRASCKGYTVQNAREALAAGRICEHEYQDILQFNRCNNIVKHQHYCRDHTPQHKHRKTAEGPLISRYFE